MLKQFEGLDLGYRSPRTTKTFIREYHLGEEVVSRTLGESSLQATSTSVSTSASFSTADNRTCGSVWV
jgi:hypothetical protein